MSSDERRAAGLGRETGDRWGRRQASACGEKGLRLGGRAPGPGRETEFTIGRASVLRALPARRAHADLRGVGPMRTVVRGVLHGVLRGNSRNLARFG
jgi:hypothetical protein